MGSRCSSFVGLLVLLLAVPALAEGRMTPALKSARVAALAAAEELLPPPNDKCVGAELLTCGNIDKRGSTAEAINDYDFTDSLTSCTEFSAAGRDVVYKLNVGVGDSLWVDYISQVDASIYIVTDCADIQNTCVVGADRVAAANAWENLRHRFTTSGVYYLILDSHGGGSGGDWRLIGQLVCGPSTPPQNDLCDAAIPLSCGPFSLSGSSQFAHDDVTLSEGSGCTTHSTAGRDVAYRLLATAGDSIWVDYTCTSDGAVYLVYDCIDPLSSCVAGIDVVGSGGTEQLRHKFTFSGAYYLIMDSRDDGSWGTWSANGQFYCTIPVPANDRCDGAQQIGCGQIDLSGTTQYAANDYVLPDEETSCTGYYADGKDIAFRLDVNTGDSLNVVYDSSTDGSIYIIGDCASPTNSCVVGRDLGVTADPETLSHAFTAGGTYYLILDSVLPNTWGTWTLVGSRICANVPVEPDGSPEIMTLGALPNPFSRSTTFRYALPRGGRTTLRIYDVLGRVARTLVDEELAPGSHQTTWDGRDDTGQRVRTGVYFARITNGGRDAMRRMILVH
jgi:hypothetical protein